MNARRFSLGLVLGAAFLCLSLGAANFPTKAEVDKVVAKNLQLVDSQVSSSQKTKIWAYVNQFPGQDSGCPGYSFEKEQTGVKTLNRLGALFQAGFEAVFKGQFPAAEWCFLQALKINSNCPVLLNNAAFTLSRAGYQADALVLLNYAVSLDPSFASAWVNIGYASAASKKYDAAKKALQMAVALNPEITEYQKALQQAYKASGQKKKVGTAEIDKALSVLNEGQKGTSPAGSSGSSVPSKVDARGAGGESMETLVSSMGSNYQSDMAVLGQFIPVLSWAGGQYIKEAGWHEQQSKKPGETQISKNIHQVGSQGLKLISLLFKGYIAEISGSWDYADDLVEKTAKSLPDRPANYDPARGLSPTTNLPPISIGFDGIVFKLDRNSDEIEVEIGEGVIFGFSHSSQGWSVKIGLGVHWEAGFMTGAGAAYFLKYDSQKGIVGEGKLNLQSLGATLDTTVSETTLFSFEQMERFVGASGN